MEEQATQSPKSRKWLLLLLAVVALAIIFTISAEGDEEVAPSDAEPSVLKDS